MLPAADNFISHIYHALSSGNYFTALADARIMQIKITDYLEIRLSSLDILVCNREQTYFCKTPENTRKLATDGKTTSHDVNICPLESQS
jgi:hypothetical protein